MNNKEIVFVSRWDVSKDHYPKPASAFLPEWYKNTESYRNNEKKAIDLGTNATIKKCIPVFDALTSGYIIPTYTDIQVSEENGLPYYNWASHEAISFHSIEQAPIHPFKEDAPYPKWNSPWSIILPKGYSIFFMPPVHGGNEFFQVLEGVVDCDNYKEAVNFPFVLKDINFRGIIPAGTPMVQVIPFKREKWKMEIKDSKDYDFSDFFKLKSRFFDGYKSLFWNKKEYK